MGIREEQDKRFKDAIIQLLEINRENTKTKTDEIKGTWNEFLNFFVSIIPNDELNLQKIKRKFNKLELEGFLIFDARSERSEGYTSPNKIRILEVEAPTNINQQELIRELQNQLDALRIKGMKIDHYQKELLRVTNENRLLQEKYDKLLNEFVQLRQTVSDYPLRGNNG